MSNLNPLDYAKPDQMVMSRKKRLIQACMIAGGFVLVTIPILVFLNQGIDPEGGNPQVFILGGIIYPLAFCMMIALGEPVGMIFLIGQLPAYGIILAIAHYKMRLRSTVVWLIAFHAISFFLVLLIFSLH